MYLDTIFAILNEFYPNEINSLKTSQDFCKIDWNSLIKKTKCQNSYDKGKVLENLAYYFFNCINDIKITGKNIRCFTEEIDLCFCTHSNDSLFWKLGPVVLVECKNQVEKISAKIIRNLSSIMEIKGITGAILFTTSALTKPALEEIQKSKNLNKKIIVLYLNDIINNTNKSPYDILKKKLLN